MQALIYALLFILFIPRMFFNFTKSRSPKISLKEAIAAAAVFTFTIIVVQWITKRYQIFEGFQQVSNNSGAPPPGSMAFRPGVGAPPPGVGAPPPGVGAPPPGSMAPASNPMAFRPGVGAPPPGSMAPANREAVDAAKISISDTLRKIDTLQSKLSKFKCTNNKKNNTGAINDLLNTTKNIYSNTISTDNKIKRI